MRKSRFSLYCLEDGDEYFGDAIADYYNLSAPPSRTTRLRGASTVAPSAPLAHSGNSLPSLQKVRGRLRVAGKALFFEPDEWNRPILMFKFRELLRHQGNENIGLFTEETAHKIAGGTLDATQMSTNVFSQGGNYFVFRCESVTTQMSGGEHAPYGTETGVRDHLFCFPFGSGSSFVDKVTALLFVERSTSSADVGARKRLVTQFLEYQEKESPFGLTMLKSADENILKLATCWKVEPLTLQRGRLVVSDQRIYFKPTFPIATTCEVVDLQNVRRVERRRCQFREVGLEVATVDDQVLLFSFTTTTSREEIFHCLGARPQLDRLRINNMEIMTKRWQSGALSTFDYLMFLNWASGRSFNDLTQYPVLPWVVVDFTSDHLDLTNPNTFRDFSKPVGALTPQRLQGFIKRANDLRSIGEVPYLYGSHFSNPAYVTYFVVRQHPEYMLVLHSGKFDHGSRLFESIQDCFNSVLTGPTDLKELIPEFFYGDGAFLRAPRSGGDVLGVKTDGTRVRRDVQLPPWAKEDPREFIRLHRFALESEFVSKRIHHWIDLIFGHLQDGAEAWAAHNVFHPYSYETCLASLDSMKDETRRAAIETHIREFGQMPKKLFCSPHPQRQCGATPESRIALEHIAPPDSDELTASQSTSAFSLATGYGQQTSGTDDAVEAQKNVEAYTNDQRDRVPTGALEFSSEAVSGLQQHRSDDSAAATKEEEEDPPHAVAPQHAATVADVERLVAEALDLAHLINEEGSRDGGDGQHDNTASDADASSADVVSNRTCGELEVLGVVKVGTRGKLDSLAVVDISVDADWIYEEYDDDVTAVPMIFAGDSAGALHVLDVVHEKRLRTVADFAQTSLTALMPVAFDKSLLLASQSGSLYVFDLGSCTCQGEFEDILGTSSITAMCTHQSSFVAVGTKTGSVGAWRVADRGTDDEHGVTVATADALLDADLPSKIVAMATDSLGKRVVAVHSGGGVWISKISASGCASASDALSFDLPANIGKDVVAVAFTRDHIITVIGRYEVSHYNLDGSEWGAFPAPCEVVFAAAGRGGRFSKDALVLASPEGAVYVVTSATGSCIAKIQIHAALGGATVVCGSVGLSVIAIGDSSGKVHSLQLPS